MTANSPRMQLGYILPSQAQKHVTVNESLRLLDALLHCAVVSATVAAEPSSPQEGDAYLLPPGRSGTNWDVIPAGHIAAFQDGVFHDIAPVAGFLVYLRDSGRLTLFDGSDWSEIPLSASNVPALGINTAGDAVNRLAVKADCELLSHDDVTPGSGNARKIVNKASAVHTASLLFQTGYSGRAEIGLIGDDALCIKVSADGGGFSEALRADAATGNVAIRHADGSPPACALDVAGPVRVGVYTVATLPPATAGAGQIVYVSNAAGGAELAFSDGANWRRASDRAVVS